VRLRRLPVLILKLRPSYRQGCGSGSALFLKVGSGSALERKAGFAPAIKSKFRSSRGLKLSRGGPWTLKMEAWRSSKWSTVLITQNIFQSILTNNELPRSEYRRRNSPPCCSPPGTGSAAPGAGPHTMQPRPRKESHQAFFSFLLFLALATPLLVLPHLWFLRDGGHGPINYKDTKTKWSLYCCLAEFIDRRYSQIMNSCPSKLLFGSPKMYTFLKQF
jgi:hypothetical protein